MTDLRQIDYEALRRYEANEHHSASIFLLGLACTTIAVLVLAFCIMDERACGQTPAPATKAPASPRNLFATITTRCAKGQLVLDGACWAPIHKQPQLSSHGDIAMIVVPDTWVWPSRGKTCPTGYTYTEQDPIKYLFRNPTCAPSHPQSHPQSQSQLRPIFLVDAALIAGDGISTRIWVRHEDNPLARPLSHSNGGQALNCALGLTATIATTLILERSHHLKLARWLPRIVAIAEAVAITNNAIRRRP